MEKYTHRKAICRRCSLRQEVERWCQKKIYKGGEYVGWFWKSSRGSKWRQNQGLIGRMLQKLKEEAEKDSVMEKLLFDWKDRAPVLRKSSFMICIDWLGSEIELKMTCKGYMLLWMEKEIYSLFHWENGIKTWNSYWMQKVTQRRKKIVRNCKRNVRAAMKRIKIGETACPNDITVKIWTCSWQSAVDFWTRMLNTIINALSPKEVLKQLMRNNLMWTVWSSKCSCWIFTLTSTEQHEVQITVLCVRTSQSPRSL